MPPPARAHRQAATATAMATAVAVLLPELALVRQSLRGRFLLSEYSERTVAIDLANRDQVEVDGELHRDLSAGGRMVTQLAGVNDKFAPLAEALSSPAEELTIGGLLRGSGWRLLFLELTGRCNERCSHCYAESSPEVTTALSWEEIQHVIDSARQVGFDRIQLTGGDPLVSPHVERAILYAKEQGFPDVEVYTNALAFNEKLADLFVEQGVSMAVSVYSHDPAIHDAVTRTPDSHARTSRSIRLAVERGIRIRIGGVQGIEDGQDEAKLREYVATLGITDDMIAVDLQREVGRGSWNDEAKLLPNKQRGHVRGNDKNGGRLCVNYHGDVVPCIFDRSTVLGNVRDLSLKECLERPLEAAGLARRLQVVQRPLACRQCQFRRELLRELT